MIKKNSFYKSLVYSDFFIVNIKSKCSKNCFTNAVNNKFLNSLNMFNLIKELKQLLHMVKYINKNKINFLLKNYFLYQIFSRFSRKFKLNKNINYCSIRIFNNANLKSLKIKNLIIITNKKMKLKKIKHLFSSNIYLLNNISMLINKELGNYSIVNKLNNYKKLIYFFLIIKKLCN